MEDEKEEKKFPEFTIKINHEAKLKGLLKNLNSIELKLCADACKEFIKILKSDLGPDFTRTYVQTSSKLVEISQAWEIRKGKPGFSRILKLISVILKHWKNNVGDDGSTSGQALDKFARSIIEEKIGDLYKELNSKEAKRQDAVLLLLASIVKRSAQLAWEVAKVFDFKLEAFKRLVKVRLRARKIEEDRRESNSTRKALVAFAMSFLEVARPRLLRGVLQQKDMYSYVLKGLGNDDEETVVYILSVLRTKVLVPESLLPPPLRSVLFGSVTLELLANISGRDGFGDAADLAHNVLVLACTDPMNGLMPDTERQSNPLLGNRHRLSDLLKKLKATEVECHRDLLLTVVKGKPLFGSTYLDEFPYNLEDPASANWCAAISLAADVVSSVNDHVSFGFGDKPPEFDSTAVKDILKCIVPRPISRLVINKGLLHSDSLVKHGTLKFLLEALKLLDSLVHAIDNSSYSNYPMSNSWSALKVDIQNGVRMSLPDPQVLFSLLSPLISHFKSLESSVKRKAEREIVSDPCVNVSKRLKSSTADEEMDILVGGVNSLSEDGEIANCGREQQSENAVDILKYIGDLWGLRQCSMKHMNLRDGDTYFYSKLLDALAIYYRTMPMALEGSFDLFRFLPSNPLALPSILQQSLLQLLNEYVCLYSKDANPVRTQPQMYKHLHPFVILLMYSPVKEIKEQAYNLAKAAMLSTGAFDRSPRQILLWLFFIPGFSGKHIYVNDLEVEILQKLSSVVVSFLCDAISTIGNNLYKYMEYLRNYLHDSEDGKDLSLEVSPFIICILEKCIRLLSSESGSFTLPQKSLVSLYVCNTIKYLLDTQVNAGTLSFLVDRVLSEKLENVSSRVDILEPVECPCEWRPLKTLLHFLHNMLHQKCYNICSNVEEVRQSTNSFISSLVGIKEVMKNEYDIGLGGVTVGFSFSLLCTKHIEILQNFPVILAISSNLLEVPFSILASIFFSESNFLADISKLWPEMFLTGLENATYCKEKKDQMFDKVNLDSPGAASDAFASYLRRIPFCVLLSSIVQSSSLHLCENSMLQKLLLDKLIEMPSDHLLSSLCNILFWINHARSSYKLGSVDEPQMLSEMCCMLAEHVLKLLLVDTVSAAHVRAPQSLHYAVEVAEIIFKHPAVTAVLSSPLSGTEDFPDLVFGETLEIFLQSAKQGVHRIDHHVLNLLRTVSEHLFPMNPGEISEQVTNDSQRISGAFRELELTLFRIFKNNFEECLQSMDFKPFGPAFYALHSLVHFISPFELLELVNWLFAQIDFVEEAFHQSSKEDALFVCLHLAGCSFDRLSEYMGRPNSESCNFVDRRDCTRLDVSLFEGIFFQVFDIACRFRLDIADIWLLKAVRVIKMQRVIEHPHLPCIMVLSRIIASTPVKIVSHCLQRINRTKAELLYLIVELSPLHLSVFGHMLFEILNKPLPPKTIRTKDYGPNCFSDDELVMLLPTVLLYLNSATSKFGEQLREPFACFLLVYRRVLLGGFSNWKIFVSGNTFEIGFVQSLPASTEEFLNLFSGSLLGKAILMVRDHLASSEDLMVLEKRLSIFNSVCPYAGAQDNILDCDENISLDFVNRTVAKVNFCRMLLLANYNRFHLELGAEDKKISPVEVNSDIKKARIQLLRMLINSWIFIIKKYPENIDYSANADDQNLLFRFLEVFMMNNILELTTEMHGCLIKLNSLPFIDQLVKSFLLYRFGDPLTLKMLRTVLAYLSHGKFSCASVIQLLLAHSQFAKSFQLACKSLVPEQCGLVFTPLPSFLKLFVVPRTDLSNLDIKTDTLSSQRHLNLLELVKLVRVLFRIYWQQREVDCGENMDINFRELEYLLLSSYGATCNEVDVEIYNLILEIESTDKSIARTVAQMNYLWGVASLKMRELYEQANDVHSPDSRNMEVIEETRKIQFRENLPIDPKLCAWTVLHFPYYRVFEGGILHRLKKDNPTVVHETSYKTADKLHVYDPVYILRFSINCLSVNYVEPIEFASLGLLGIAFISTSSPDDNVRKLGYEALATFKNALEKCRKKKDVRRLRLLLSYFQNGIEEPWQRIPSIIAVFIAEASLVLLDQSHANYSSITKHLLNSPSVNMKAIPLFQYFFWSSSRSFRADRLWMLRLLCVGLNMEDDAQTYIRNSIFENLMSFYSSPLSDYESKELIVQIVKKAVQSHRMAWFLVERCGLILWLSSIVSSLHGSECGDKKFTLTLLPTILEVVNDITLLGSIVDWLQIHALEQLSEFSSHLFKLLVGGVELIKEQSSLCNSILQIVTLTVKISQKRRIYQPHFTLSEEGLFQLYKAVEICSKTRCNPSMLLGLKAVLMCTPPVTIIEMDKEKLSKFLGWAVTTAVQEKSTKILHAKDSTSLFTVVSEKNAPEDSLVSKLLRWLTASVILGKISRKLSKLKCDSLQKRPSLHTLMSLLGCSDGEVGKDTGDCSEDVLAASIFYLLQLLGFNHSSLSSVVSALCLLLLSGSSSESEFLDGLGISLQSLCSKIHCPAEANAAWRWSFYKPWRDPSLELNDVEKLDEIHARERLLVVASNILVRKSRGSHFLSLKDVDDLHVYDWERSLIQSE